MSIPRAPVETLGEVAVRVATLAGAARRLDRDGYMRVPSFCGGDTLDALTDAATGRLLASTATAAARMEPGAAASATRAARSETASLLFGVHHLPACRSLLTSPALVDLARHLLGGDVDCFISVYRERTPGHIGEAWHQDGFWYPAAARDTLVAWLSLTDAGGARGVLEVLPGSHTAGLLAHQPDTREGSGHGWMHVPRASGDRARIDLDAGDLMLMQGTLLHSSQPNTSRLPARELLLCFAAADAGHDSATAPFVDRMPWLRAGRAAPTRRNPARTGVRGRPLRDS